MEWGAVYYSTVHDQSVLCVLYLSAMMQKVEKRRPSKEELGTYSESRDNSKMS